MRLYVSVVVCLALFKAFIFYDCGDRLIKEKGYTISNIDSTICAQKPKLKDYIDPMRECLASVLELDPDQVSVKATTTEKLGFVGKEEGIAAQAVVLLKKI